jgi:hypothetical protein
LPVDCTIEFVAFSDQLKQQQRQRQLTVDSSNQITAKKQDKKIKFFAALYSPLLMNARYFKMGRANYLCA